MPIETMHQDRIKQSRDWEEVRDTIEGSRAVTDKRTLYLPAPPGMMDDAAKEVLISGKQVRGSRYHFYASFAEFPEIVGPALDAMQGLIHEKAAVVELPTKLEYLIDRATPSGETLETLWKVVTREVLSTGRISLLGEIMDNDELSLCSYFAEALINWRIETRREGGSAVLAVLGENVDTKKPEDDFEMEVRIRYRELRLVEEQYWVRVWDSKEGDTPKIVVDPEFTDADGWMVPQLMGQPLSKIPLIVINSDSVGFEFGRIPVLPMSKRALAIYRKTATYNRAIYVKCDPQLILWGIAESDAPTEIGGSSIWAFENTEGKGQYLEPDGSGIPLQRESINDEYARFNTEAGKLLEASDRTGAESGEALRRRLNAQQVTVKSLTIQCGEGVEAALRCLGRISGLSDNEIDSITFKPSLDFTEPMMTGRELLEFVQSKNQGAPLSEKALHDIMRGRNVTNFTYEEELDLISEEAPNLGTIGQADDVVPPTGDKAEEPETEKEPELQDATTK